MKILYFFEETGAYMYKWQRLHIFDELQRFGHQIEVFNPRSYSCSEEANTMLLRRLKKTGYNLFMTGSSSEAIFEQTIKEIGNKGIPTLLICFDNLHAPYMHRRIAPLFDIVWLTSKETLSMFESWGCKKIIFQSYAANPYAFSPSTGVVDNSVCFIGTPYGSRVNKINELTQSKIRVKLYSNNAVNRDLNEKETSHVDNLRLLNNALEMLRFEIGRKVLLGALKNKLFCYGSMNLIENNSLELLPSVSFVDMQRIYSQSSLSLNITELRNTYVLNTPVHKIHLRTFEIPMCGGLSISSYTEELASYFEEDKEIIMYRSKEELISKSKFYSDPKNNALNYRLKRSARDRALAEHTWMNRFNKVFNELK